MPASSGGFLGGIGHCFELVECGDGLEVEEEVGLFLLLLGVDLVNRLGEFPECVGALDHGCDDVVDADLLAFNEVAHGLAATDLQAELEVGLSADFNQAKEFVDAGALGFKFGFDGYIAEFIFTQLEQLQHLAFTSIHLISSEEIFLLGGLWSLASFVVSVSIAAS